jgi:cytochrome c1
MSNPMRFAFAAAAAAILAVSASPALAQDEAAAPAPAPEAAAPAAAPAVAAPAGMPVSEELAAELAGDPLATVAVEPEHHHFHFQGLFGTYDRAAVQRGYQVYREICAACHGMEYVYFRTLGEDGGPFHDEEYPNANDNPVIKALAAEFQITDGPDDFGEMFQRPGRPSDAFPEPFPNVQAARAANGGATPPDLSVITKARHHGPDYLASLMLGYVPAPEGFEVQPGLYYNPYFEGRQIAMPQQIRDGSVTYADGTEATAEQISRDVAEFLAWAAEPKFEARRQMGLAVIGFLVVLSLLTYLSYRAIWHNIEH